MKDNKSDINEDLMWEFLELLVKISFEKDNFPNELKTKEYEILESWTRVADKCEQLSPFIVPKYQNDFSNIKISSKDGDIDSVTDFDVVLPPSSYLKGLP